MIVVAIIAAIAIPLYANVQARARIAKAQADARALASAISIYAARMGSVPGGLSVLTAVATNGQNQTAGPFMATLPTPPNGWTGNGTAEYAFAGSSAAGTFNISATGDATSVSLPSRVSSFFVDGGGSALPRYVLQHRALSQILPRS